MTGRRVPRTRERALAFMLYNFSASAAGRRRLKRLARREERRYLADIDRKAPA